MKKWPIASELEMTGLFWFNIMYWIERNKEFEMSERICLLRPNQPNWRIPTWLNGISSYFKLITTLYGLYKYLPISQIRKSRLREVKEAAIQLLLRY